MARGHSYLWTPSVVVSELVANAVIALATAVIAVVLLRAAARAPAGGARFAKGLLGLFAIGLAAAHALDVWVIWTPVYGVDIVVRAATAAAAIAAAVILPRLLRKG